MMDGHVSIYIIYIHTNAVRFVFRLVGRAALQGKKK